MVATTPLVLVVHPGMKIDSLKGIIALAKERPTQLNYASSGSGTGSHLSGGLFEHMAGIKITHVPSRVPPSPSSLFASEKTAGNLYINNVNNEIFEIIISIKIVS